MVPVLRGVILLSSVLVAVMQISTASTVHSRCKLCVIQATLVLATATVARSDGNTSVDIAAHQVLLHPTKLHYFWNLLIRIFCEIFTDSQGRLARSFCQSSYDLVCSGSDSGDFTDMVLPVVSHGQSCDCCKWASCGRAWEG